MNAGIAGLAGQMKRFPMLCIKGLKMIQLHWIFTNGHKWHKEFYSETEALNHVYTCGFLLNPFIDRVFLVSNDGETWIKEKA